MCSVSWVRRRGSLVVVMNRDERRERAPGRPPRRWRGADGGFTAPLDGDGGGTWIAARDSGVVLALLNHQASNATVAPAGVPRVSRGRLVTALAGESGVPDAARLRAEGLASFSPFRFLVVGPRLAPRVFTWNGVTLTARRLDPRIGFLTSSSWNSRGVIPARQARFRTFVRAVGTPTRTELIAFHDQAQTPRGPAYAVRMARADARTVSRTVVEWRSGRVSMDYQACPDSGEPT